MPKRTDIKTILVIGSGPIVIGQAAEFDYSGSQACQALKEEGYEVILVNSNPATIMTDVTMADKVYLEPLTVEFLIKIIRKEKPDAILPTVGGQTGLNLVMELSRLGILEKYNVELLGTQLQSIEQAEDRSSFKQLMQQLNEPVPKSTIVKSIEEALNFVKNVGFPVIVRPAYTLGGTGGGMGYDEQSLIEIVKEGLLFSPVQQCLIEQSIAGYKELEFEVIRDQNDEAIVVCHIENVDPVGIHTGDSIVVAPSQTLLDSRLKPLKETAIKIIRALKIEGGCNVQIALDPNSSKYYIIEVNPRVSRSSALASKATAYPIAKVAAKIAVGLTLDEITINHSTKANVEPKLNYVVTKIPRWPFDKFQSANRKLGTQMKATGEVMAIGKTFQESLLKAIRSLELSTTDLLSQNTKTILPNELETRLIKADDERLFLIAEAFRRGWSLEKIQYLTKINRYFLNEIKELVNLEIKLSKNLWDKSLLKMSKQKGFSDVTIAKLWQTTEDKIYKFRKENNIIPSFLAVNSFKDDKIPYFYSSYNKQSETKIGDYKRKKVIVLGSGPIRIGQGIEFDYSTVHSLLALKKAGYEAIVINNNPETVSTDYQISNKLFFEPLTTEDVINVIDAEKPDGVIIQFGGQTAISLVNDLEKLGVKILGTSKQSIDLAEDRNKFDKLLEKLNIKRPDAKAVSSKSDAIKYAKKLGFPLLVRPSYVIGGRAMEIIYEEEELKTYIDEVINLNPTLPVLIDRYITGIELEIDAISDGQTVFIPGIMEHIERAGIHSGDSIAVYPPQTISDDIKLKCIEITKLIAKELKIIGLVNIQLIYSNGEIYVIEVNPRSSRTVPFMSKVTNYNLAEIATNVMLGKTLEELGYDDDYFEDDNEMIAVKVPVFSFQKLRRVDIALGPEMKSTGEVIGSDQTLEKALYKGLIASGIQLAKEGSVLITVADQHKDEVIEIAQRFYELGFDLFATEGTAERLSDARLPVKLVKKLDKKNDILHLIENGEVQYVINTLSSGKKILTDGFMIRRKSVENGIPCFTSLDTVRMILNVLESMSLTCTFLTNKKEMII